ncbi:hypothetical protein CBW65_18520 [Tumebacillus avium]|uniref:Uncharacterized protein n=1 Tax=Tumebacillus avium TaxID=1903704 RepID=A0A1Y0IQ84_9BACL|nr:HYD1 signature containing ADP-ribosyltransferase family protein [Tumebacillus avium]ARU62738.1 hypothetical protein CBW65_18520 [Tumebacillus avium]
MLRKSRFRSAMSILLSFAILLGAVPGSASSVQATEDRPLGKDESFSSAPTEPVELQEERTINSKRFLNPNGSTTVKVYGQPIHYKNESTGSWLPIDSNLQEKANGNFRNKANRFAVELKRTANSGFTDFHFEGTALSFRPLFAGDTEGIINGNMIKYENIVPLVDLTYDVTAYGLKETIILKDASAPSVYSFEMKSSNLTYQTNEDGSVSFFKQGQNTPLLTLQRPFMVDANQNMTHQVEYKFKSDENGKVYVDIVADATWLQDPERAYPVQIDPTVRAEFNTKVYDTFVESFSPNSACGYNSAGNCVKFTDWYNTLIGNGDNHGVARSLYQFQLPDLPNGAVVHEAHFAVQNVKIWETTQTPIVEARRIKKPWSHDTVTWNQANTAGFVDDTNKASYTAKAAEGDWWSFDITKIVKDWYTGEQPNYGIELRYQNETHVMREIIASSPENGPHYGPVLEINYVPEPLGEQSFWTFDGPVNMANLNLYQSFMDISYPGLGTDVELSRAYNSRSTESGFFGYGWSSAFDARLQELTDGSVRLKEADGSIHFFEQNASKTGYEPLEGLYWKLERSGSNLLIKTPEKTTYTFGKGGWLTEIRDAAGNTVTFLRDAYGKVSSFKDKAGHAITLTYGGNGKVATATDPAGKRWSYFYDGSGNLTKVTQPAPAPVGGDILYRYDNARNLAASVTPEGKTTYYQYGDDDFISAINVGNGMSNSNFEVDADGDLIPDHLIGNEGQATGLKDAAAGSPYGQALKVSVASGTATPYAVYLSEKISVDRSKAYTLSGFMKATQTSGAHYTLLSLLAYNASGTLIGEVESATRPTEQGSFNWKRVAKTYSSLPTNTAFVAVKLATTNGTGAGTSWFDAVQLEQASAVGEFVSGDQYTAYAPTMQAANYDGEGKKRLYQYNKNLNMEMLQRDPAVLKLTDKYGWNANEKTSHTDPMGRVWNYQYNDQGSLTYSKNPKNDEAWNSYDADQNLVASQGLRGEKEKSYYTYDSGKHEKTSRDPYYTSQSKEHNADGNVTSETSYLGWADNLVDNSSFESEPNEDGTPAHFSFNAGEKAAWAQEADAFVGQQALRLSASSSKALGYTVLQSDLVSVEPTKEYVLSGYLKALQQSGNQNTVLSVLAYNSSDGYLGEVGKISLNGAFDWQRWNTAIRPGDFPVNTTKVRVKVATANGTGEGSSSFDAIQLQKNPVDTAYNLLDNSSFERGISGAELPEFWEKTPLDGTYSLVSGAAGVGTNVYAGNRAVSVSTTSDPTGSTGYNYGSLLQYDENKSYNFSAFVKTANGATATLKIAMFDSSGALLGAVTNSQYGTSDWKRLSVELPNDQAIAGTVFLKPLLRTGSTTGTVFFDNVRLQTDSVTARYGYKAGTGWLSKTTNANGNSSTYEYDASGNETSITSPKQYVTNKSYDALNRLTEVKLPGGNLTIKYSYDRDGQLLAITDSASTGESRQTSLKYSALDQISEVTDPFGKITTHTYTPNGNLKQTKLPNGQTLSYGYDKADRKTDISLNGAKRYQFANIDANGNIKEVKDLKLALSWSSNYDELNRMTLWKDNQGQVEYSYDENGNVTQKTLKSLESATVKTQWFSYNLVNQPIAMTDADGKASRFLYNEHNKISTLKKGNDTIMHAEYDNLGHVTEIRNQTISGALLSAFSYEYDKEQNLTSVQDQTGTKWSYQYTPRGQLEKETASTGEEITYVYDAFGNRIHQEAKLADGTVTSTTYQYDSTKTQLVKVDNVEWTYDAAGRVTSNGTYTYEWDAASRLTAVIRVADNSVVASYEYDHLGRRVMERVQEHVTQYLYDGDSNNVVAEFADAVLQKYYTWSPTGQLLSITDMNDGGATYYTVHNHRGDIINLTDSSGNIVATYKYNAWGVLLSETGEAAKFNPYLYAGYRYDRDTGLYYLNARYYDPMTSVFLSADPISKMPSYHYSRNNPILLVDPSGMMEKHMDGPYAGGNPAVGRAIGEAIFGPPVPRVAGGGSSSSTTLYHYTNEAGMNGIVSSNKLNPSLKSVSPKDVRYGDGQYMSDFVPGQKTPGQLSKEFLSIPWQGKKYTHYIGIDVTGLPVKMGRPGVYVVPNDVPLDLSGRIVSYGRVILK